MTRRLMPEKAWPLRRRPRRFILGGALSLTVWLIALNIKGYPVIRFLERFAIYDDGRYLLAAAANLVLLNTIRAAPLNLGWFFIGEGVSQMKSGKDAYWLIPLIAIPSTYMILYKYMGDLHLHFGSPAIFSLLSVCVMHFATREIRGWLARSLVLFLLVFSFQWLDIAPSLTRWGFGGGELSTAVKTIAVIGEWDWVIDAMAFLIFTAAFAGGIVAAVLLVGMNVLNIQYRILRDRDRKIAEMREEAITVRGYREIQHLVHDLRRPLTTVLGLADVMASTLPGGDLREYAHRIVRTGGSMNQMIEELLKEGARQHISVGELVEYINSQISAYEWRHVVETSVGGDAAAARLCVNRVRISRALVNVLDNARLAAAAEAVPRVFFSVNAASGGMEFRVTDNGRGFSRKHPDRGGFSEWGSTGIGLAFAGEVVRKHGGILDIVNLPQGGASVTITLPCEAEPQDAGKPV